MSTARFCWGTIGDMTRTRTSRRARQLLAQVGRAEIDSVLAASKAVVEAHAQARTP
jgi:hypothetical protein